MRNNFKGFTLLALTVGGMLLLGRHYPELGASRFFPLYTAMAFTAVAVAASAQGISSKLLFVPTWWAGLCAVCWAFGDLGGGWWVLAVVGGLLTIFAGLAAIGIADEKKQWLEAPGRLLEAKEAALLENWPTFWKAAERAFYSKGSSVFPPDVCRHDLQVLSLVSSQVPPSEVPSCFQLVRERLELGAREQGEAGTRVDTKPLGELLKWLKAKAPSED